MRRPFSIFLALALVGLATLVPLSVAYGQSVQIPNTFYGDVRINGGQPAPAGLSVTAIVDGSKRYSIGIAGPGRFGGPDFYDPKLMVGGDGQGEIINGSQIQFFVTVSSNDFPVDQLILDGVLVEEIKFNSEQSVSRLDLSVTLTEPTITVVKEVINDNGGTAGVGSFTLRIDGNPVGSGEVTTVGAGTHTVNEDNPGSGYTSVIGGACAADGRVTLLPGEAKTCRVTNNDVPHPGRRDDDDDDSTRGVGGGTPDSGGGSPDSPIAIPTPMPAAAAPVIPRPIAVATATPRPNAVATATPRPNAMGTANPAPEIISDPTPAPSRRFSPKSTPVPAPEVVPLLLADSTGGLGIKGGGRLPWWVWVIVVMGGAALIPLGKYVTP